MYMVATPDVESHAEVGSMAGTLVKEKQLQHQAATGALSSEATGSDRQRQAATGSDRSTRQL